MPEAKTLMSSGDHRQRIASIIARYENAKEMTIKLPLHPAFVADTAEGRRLRKRFDRAARRMEKAQAQMMTELQRSALREAIIGERLLYLLKVADHRANEWPSDAERARAHALREAYDCFNGILPDMPGSPHVVQECEVF